MWVELEITRDGDLIRISGRGSRGERPSAHTIQRSTGSDALQALTQKVGRAVRAGRALDAGAVRQAQDLYDEVFQGELRDVVARLGEAARDGRVLLRLFMTDRSLQSTPWEALCKPGTTEGFLGTDPKLMVARGVASSEPWIPREVRGAVRVLAIAPCSEETALLPLRDALGPSIATGTVEWLEPIAGDKVSARHLFHRLRTGKSPHIVHWLGHGGVDPEGPPVLRLSDDDDEEVWVTAEAIARELGASFGEDLRLIILESCEGASPGGLGTAAEIFARAGADAVVAFLWPVKADVARICSTELYRTLTASERRQGNVGAAVAAARRTLLASSAEAFSPILYLRGADSVIFDFSERRLNAAAAKPAPRPGAQASTTAAAEPGGPRPAGQQEPRVFISCRGDVAEDVEIALSFYEALVAAGASPFLGPKSITESENWVRAVSSALRRCDVFLLLLSEQASVSEMVAAELDLARQLSQTHAGKPLILPVRLGFAAGDLPDHPLQERLQDLEGIAWVCSDDTADVVRVLLEKIGRHDLTQRSPAREPSFMKMLVPWSVHRVTAGVPLELPGGIVSAQSPYYVVRPSIEDACLREIKKIGALIRIKGPRQMGKTSLMARLLDHAARARAQTVTINLQMVDGAFLGDLNRFLRWLCAIVTRRLKLPAGRVDEAWDDIFGAKDNCTAYFEEHILPECDALVLALDHVDRIFESPGTAEELLALLRAWHEMSKSQAPWHKLRLVLAHSTEIYLPMNINRSPFNVGLPVALGEWDEAMVLDLAKRHGLAWGSVEVEQLMGVLGGHPHLVRLALYHVAGGMSLDDVLATGATDQGLFADHLKHLLWQLQSRPELCEAASQVMAASEPLRLSTEVSFKLASLGLVRLHGNEVRPARELYRRYLTERLAVDGGQTSPARARTPP